MVGRFSQPEQGPSAQGGLSEERGRPLLENCEHAYRALQLPETRFNLTGAQVPSLFQASGTSRVERLPDTHITPTNLKGSDHSKRMYDASPPLLGQMAFVKQNGTVSGSLDRAWDVHRLCVLSSQGVGGWRRSQLSPWRNNEAGSLPISLALIQLTLWFQAS